MSHQEDDEIETLKRKLRAAEQRAEEERQEREAAEKRAGAAEQRAGAAEQRAGAAEQRAGAAEQRAEEERQEREAAEKRAEKERQEREAAEKRLAEEKEQSDNTSLPKFLELCHNHLSLPLPVQTDLSLTTGGPTTSPNGRKHPTYLRPWEDFPQLHQHYFDQAYKLLCPDDDPPKLFTPRIVIEELGHKLCRRPLASESDLQSYERFAVEGMVREVMEQLMKIPEAKDLLHGCDEMEFENHLNTLSDKAEEVVQRQEVAQHQKGAMDQVETQVDHQRRSAIDQACVFRNAQGDRSLLFVREYKAAHKLTVEYLRAGLRPMEVREEVIQRATIPTDPEEKLKYNADRLVSAAVTQTFEYMIDNGLEYSRAAT